MLANYSILFLFGAATACLCCFEFHNKHDIKLQRKVYAAWCVTD